MSAGRHILWGSIVGAGVAVAFHILLGLQFDADVPGVLLAVSTPICAASGGIFGWLWWRMFKN